MNARQTRRLTVLALLALSATVVVGCTDSAVSSGQPANGQPGTMQVSSGAFDNGAPIPSDYTCDGANHQPPVSWTGAPTNTAEFALVMDDPDAGGFVHWVVVGIPSDTTALSDPLPEGATAALNGKGQAGYTGPCPTSGTHHYRVQVFALSAPLGLGANAAADQVKSAIVSKTLATGELDGTYTRGSASGSPS